jgi:hypothetical protein
MDRTSAAEERVSHWTWDRAIGSLAPHAVEFAFISPTCIKGASPDPAPGSDLPSPWGPYQNGRQCAKNRTRDRRLHASIDRL